MASNEIWTNEEIELCLIQLLIENCCEIINLDRENIRKEKSEKPDFIVRDGTHTVGVEITRALNENSQKVHSIIQQDENLQNISFGPRVFEGKKMTKGEIKENLERQRECCSVSIYQGNQLEEKSFDNIKKAIDKKRKKFDTYTKYDTNILLVHSEKRVTLDVDFVVEKLSKYVSQIEIKFNWIALKLGDAFYFCNKHETKSISIKKSLKQLCKSD